MSAPLPTALRPLAAPMSLAYRAAIGWRNRRYDQPGHVQRMERPVISVGNITVGGTGKTPTVMWIVEQLCDAGYRPVIAMRGYGARPGELSDEESEYMHRLASRDVDVLVNPDRCQAIRGYLRKNREIDCIVLDDAFQHRRIHRDLDLVLIDATRNTFADRVLPAGWLREPLENLHRAHGVFITRAQGGFDTAIDAAVRKFHGRPPLAWSRHRWSQLERHDSNGSHVETIDWLAGKRIVTMLGIGNPQAMRDQLAANGAMIVRDVAVRDHQHYGPSRADAIAKSCGGADAFVTTSKDWVKLRPLIQWQRWPVSIVVPQVNLDIFAGADDFRERVLDVVAAKPAPVGA